MRSAVLWTLSMLLLGSACGWLHELAHLVAARALGLRATLLFEDGGHVETIPDEPQLLVVVAGPLLTLLLASGLTLTLRGLRPMRDSILEIALTVAALWNSLFRLSSLVDGAHSDEAKAAALLGVPALVIVLPVVLLSLLLAHLALKERVSTQWQPLAIPALFVACALSFRAGFYVLALVF